MNYLLDTCAWLDAFLQPQFLSDSTRRLLGQQEYVSLSAISLWEVAVKHARGNLHLAMPIEQWMQLAIPPGKVRIIPISPEVAIESTRLPNPFHQDPADRLIVASARIHGLSVLTSDTKLLSYRHVKSIPTR